MIPYYNTKALKEEGSAVKTVLEVLEEARGFIESGREKGCWDAINQAHSATPPLFTDVLSAFKRANGIDDRTGLLSWERVNKGLTKDDRLAMFDKAIKTLKAEVVQ